MKLDFKDLKRVIDYIERYSDKGVVKVTESGLGNNHALTFTFCTPRLEDVEITLPADEQSFGRITKTERF